MPAKTQPLSEILRLHRRAEAHAAVVAVSPFPSSSSAPSHSQHLADETSDDESNNDAYSSSDEDEDPRLHPSWNLSNATNSDDAAHSLPDGQWHHHSLRKVLPQEAIIAIVVAGTFIMSLIIFGVWYGKRKKRLAEEEERAWREIEDETARAKVIAQAQARKEERERERNEEGGWRGRVRRSMYSVRHSFGGGLHGHHGGGGGGRPPPCDGRGSVYYGEMMGLPRGVHFAPETRGGRY